MLFIQGVGVHGDGWLPQIDQLSATYTCVSFDNRGMGRSLPAAAAISVEQMATDAEAVLQAVLQAVQVERAHVVGHSLGGLAGRGPQAVGGWVVRGQAPAHVTAPVPGFYESRERLIFGSYTSVDASSSSHVSGLPV